MRYFVKKISLAAIANCIGNLNSGHYTCLLKDGETWWHCNDKAVVPVNMDDISKYIYIYIILCLSAGGLTDHSLILWELTLPHITLFF